MNNLVSVGILLTSLTLFSLAFVLADETIYTEELNAAVETYINTELTGLDCTSTLALREVLRERGKPADIAVANGGYMWELYWPDDVTRTMYVYHVRNESRFSEFEICSSSTRTAPYVD